MDGIHLPFENVLDYSSFSLRVPEADVHRLPSILRAVPPSRVAQMQAALRLARSRFGYASLAHNELQLARTLSPESLPADGRAKKERPASWFLPPLAAEAEAHEDALHTVLRILLHRAARRKGELGSAGLGL